MRLAWILLAALAAVHATGESTVTSTEIPSTTVTDTVETTITGKAETPASTASEAADTASTQTPDGKTDAPVTDGPVVTDDGNTDNTPKPTEKTTVKVDTTTKTTTLKGSTTTKEPQPDVESFSVTCSKTTSLCTYTMQVPGLDIDTFDRLIKETNDTETAVENYESTDLVNLQAGVTKVFEDAGVTADYVDSQLKTITQEIKDLQTQAAELENDINGINTDVTVAKNYLNKILNKKGSCLYRQCVLKETTTTKPKTTTTTKPPPVLYCDVNPNPCLNGGKCNDRYGSYYCTCVGNLDGQDYNCATSVDDIVKDAQAPGLVVSPGFYPSASNDNNTATEDCDGAQWTIKATSIDKNAVLDLEETSTEFTAAGNYISKLSADSNLQLTVGKYKLKITSKTKYTQITQILGYGPSATISYSGPKEDYFHFTIKERIAPTTPTPPK